MHAQMFDQLVDTLGQQCHLNFGRTGIRLMNLIVVDNL
jgi:hypothetical protein